MSYACSELYILALLNVSLKIHVCTPMAPIVGAVSFVCPLQLRIAQMFVEMLNATSMVFGNHCCTPLEHCNATKLLN
jgi:hypothetical protein